jgi:hypothetical protein
MVYRTSGTDQKLADRPGMADGGYRRCVRSPPFVGP